MSAMKPLVSFAAIALLAVLTGCPASDAPAADGSQEIALINVSYDPTRELYKDLHEKFAAYYRGKTGKSVKLNTSHGGSGSQARAVLGGLKADLVTLALASDIEALEDRGFIRPGWQAKYPNNSSPYTSTIVFLVRKGNPKNIRSWDDLVRSDVSVITPNPKTSGGARWNFLAAWGHVTQNGGDEKKAAEFVKRLYERVPVLDTGARGSTTTFVQKKLGDVFISWENEGTLALKEAGADAIEIIYPDHTILAEPPVAIVDKNVDAKGTRAAAEEFVRYLYTDEAQEIIAKWGYRPSNPAILAKHQAALPPIRKLFTIKDVAGSWRDAQKKFFVEGALFDQIYQPR
jgi:sulfate transport system substrate-binding protein